jgi:hypothetical protein
MTGEKVLITTLKMMMMMMMMMVVVVVMMMVMAVSSVERKACESCVGEGEKEGCAIDEELKIRSTLEPRDDDDDDDDAHSSTSSR